MRLARTLCEEAIPRQKALTPMKEELHPHRISDKRRYRGGMASKVSNKYGAKEAAHPIRIQRLNLLEALEVPAHMLMERVAPPSRHKHDQPQG